MTQEPFTLVVTHVFRTSGKKAMSENELANHLSLHLHWFSPKSARGLVAGLVRSGHLVREEDGRLVPGMDTSQVDVPLTFKPDPDLALKVPPAGSVASRPDSPSKPAQRAARTVAPERPTQDERPEHGEDEGPVEHVQGDGPPTTVQGLLEVLADRSGENVPVWVERMNRTAQRCGDLIAPEAALLLAAAVEGIDVRDWARPVAMATAERALQAAKR